MLKRVVAALLALSFAVPLPTQLYAATLVSNPDKTYHVASYGIVADGTDQYTKIASLISTVYAAGGGIIEFGPGTFRIDSVIRMPDDDASVPHTKTIVIKGAGAANSCLDVVPGSATILDMRAGSGVARIDSRGDGLLVIQDLTMTSVNAGGSIPFVQVTNTTIKARNVAFQGRNSGDAADEDAFVLGATDDTSGKLSTSQFSGYGTVIQACWFNKIRYGILGQSNCNAVQIVNNTWWNQCGGDAAIKFNGRSTAYATGNYVAGNLIEVASYTYGIKCIYSQTNQFIGNSFYDPSVALTAYYYLDANSENNVMVDGYQDNTKTYIVDNTSGGRYTRITSDYGQACHWSSKIEWTSNSPGDYSFVNASGVGPMIKDTTYNRKWYDSITVSGSDPSGTNKRVFTYRDTSDVSHNVASFSREGSGRWALRFEADATASGDIVSPTDLRLYSPGGSGKTISIGSGYNELVTFPSTSSTTFTGLVANSLATGLTATGTSNSDALTISKQTNIVTTTASGTGVIITTLPPTGAIITVANKGANALLVYPTSGKAIDALTATTGGYSIAATASCRFVYDGTQFRSLP